MSTCIPSNFLLSNYSEKHLIHELSKLNYITLHNLVIEWIQQNQNHQALLEKVKAIFNRREKDLNEIASLIIKEIFPGGMTVGQWSDLKRYKIIQDIEQASVWSVFGFHHIKKAFPTKKYINFEKLKALLNKELLKVAKAYHISESSIPGTDLTLRTVSIFENYFREEFNTSNSKSTFIRQSAVFNIVTKKLGLSSVFFLQSNDDAEAYGDIKSTALFHHCLAKSFSNCDEVRYKQHIVPNNVENSLSGLYNHFSKEVSNSNKLYDGYLKTTIDVALNFNTSLEQKAEVFYRKIQINGNEIIELPINSSKVNSRNFDKREIELSDEEDDETHDPITNEPDISDSNEPNYSLMVNE